MDSHILTILVEATSLIAVFAAIAAGVVMASVTKKFGTGILASGFKSIAIGVLFIAAGIMIDAIASYVQTADIAISSAIILVKELLFVVGTYIIVIGSKKTGDKLESLTK